MRSRNGTRALTLGLYSLALCLPLHADAYRIGYSATVKDALLVDETLNIARAMTPCSGNLNAPLYLEHNASSLHELLQSSEAFLHYLHQHTLHVKHRDQTQNARSHSVTTLTFPTHCFEVEFNNDFAKITLIK